MIELDPHVVELLRSGFDCAGDGAVDPFYPEQRKIVERALEPHRNLLDLISQERVADERKEWEKQRKQQALVRAEELEAEAKRIREGI